ncbi:MAG: DUF349 domain-containing protein [Pseudomonadales bacterium]
MLRRFFKNRPPSSAKKPTRPTDPAPPETPAAAPAPASPLEALLRLPTAQAAASIDAVDAVDDLIELALKARGELRERVLAHPRLAPAPALTALEKRSRDKDKTVNRHARRQLDRRRTLLHEAEAAGKRAEELAAALTRRDSTGQDRAWRERQHELHRRLEETLDGYATTARQLAEFGDVLADLETLRVDRATLPAVDEPSAGDAPAADAPTPDAASSEPANQALAEPFEPLVDAFQRLDAAMAAGHPFEAIAAERQSVTERWLRAADQHPPEPAEHQIFETVSHRFHELADAVQRLGAAAVPDAPPEPLSWPAPDTVPARTVWNEIAQRDRQLHELERAERSVRWPQWAAPTPDLRRLRDCVAALRTEIAQAQQRRDQELTALTAHLDALASAIDDGHLGPAQSLLAQARARHDALPAEATRELGRRIGQQAARLAELKDWQTFATTPKRESLVEAIATLARTPLAPADQADRIKSLRQQWQALGPITQAADGRLADRFNAEAEKAFETCRAYFAELAEQRKANLNERRRLCDQLERYLQDTDWRSADMKAAEQIMRTARDEWRLYHPVDRNPGKAVEARFESLQGQLHDRVKAEWDRNLAAKQALVTEAETLIDADLAVAEKVEAAKSLQRRWREVGVTPRRPDQQLWQAFRKACDQIFAAREDARHAEDAALAELEQRLAADLDAFASRLDTLDVSAATDAELREFRHRTGDLERLPAHRRRALSERRRALEQAYGALLAQRERHLARQRLADARHWDVTAAEAEAAGAGVPSAEDSDAVSEEVVAARRACGGPVPTADLQRLAVRAELAAGLASPETDQALRMEVQVERLQAGLSGGGRDLDVAALAAAWCRVGPKDASVATLRDRFFRALDVLHEA